MIFILHYSLREKNNVDVIIEKIHIIEKIIYQTLLSLLIFTVNIYIYILRKEKKR